MEGAIIGLLIAIWDHLSLVPNLICSSLVDLLTVAVILAIGSRNTDLETSGVWFLQSFQLTKIFCACITYFSGCHLLNMVINLDFRTHFRMTSSRFYHLAPLHGGKTATPSAITINFLYIWTCKVQLQRFILKQVFP